jgi:DNA-binding transcriptional MerR regulator
MGIETLSIGRFSQITRLTQKALRLYDEKGLLKADTKDDLTGYRYYSNAQINRGLKIKYLVWMGFSLSDIDSILRAADKNDQALIQKQFRSKLTEIEAEMDRLQKVQEYLKGSKTLEEIFMNVTPPIVKTWPKTRVVAKREKGIYNITIPKLIGEIMQQIYSPENRRAFVAVTGPMICIEWDQEFKETDADMEMCVPISGRVSVDDAFEVRNLEETEVISTIYTGPYEGIHEGYAALFNFAAKEQLVLEGPAKEIYLVPPQANIPTEKPVTEIQLPIKKNMN